MSISPMSPRQSEVQPASHPVRTFSFQHIATAILSVIGFIGLLNGLPHMMNGAWAFALALSLIIQGLAVLTIHRHKRARNTGGAFRSLRGSASLSLYVVLVFVIVTFSYSFYFRLMRADRAASENYATQTQTV